MDVRLIAATDQPLIRSVEAGRLDGEFAAWLGRGELVLPSLRDRPEDIPPLAAHFLAQAGARLGRPVSLSPEAMTYLVGRPWPGNVEELRGVIERGALLAKTPRLAIADLVFGSPLPSDDRGIEPLRVQVDRAERGAIERALASVGGNRRNAARVLGVSLRTLFNKLRRHGLG